MARHAATYDERHPLFEELRTEVEFAIRAAFRDHPVRLHSIRSRVKTRESFLGKVDRKGYKAPFEQMPDLVGARIVCLFLDDLPVIDTVLKSIFDVFDEDDKTTPTAPELFRYQSVHYQARIRADHVGPHYDNIKKFDFEIQARTILQDAWASVEHTLAYKGPRSIPNELKRDINALVGLFHVADKSFQHLRDEISRSEQSAKELVEDSAGQGSSGDAENETEVPIDRGTVKALLRQLYPERKVSDDLTYSLLVEELAGAQILTIAPLREILNDNDDVGQTLEAKLIKDTNCKVNEAGYFLTDVGIVRVTLSAIVDGFEISESDDDFEDEDEDVAVEIIDEGDSE